MPKLTVAITTKFGAAEAAQLRARAEAAGVPLRTYIRREVLRSSELSPEAALLLAESGRIRELLTRLWSVSVEEELTARRVFEIAAGVGAIEGRVLVARAMGGNDER